MIASTLSRFAADARHGQIVALTGLVAIGIWAYGFEMPWWRPATAVAVALAVQWALAGVLRLPFDWRSPTITALSLTLLLRTDGPALVALAALLAIASKAALRVDGRHFFNPATIAIALTVTLFGGAWVSPGQWGAEGYALVFAAGAGLAVTYGARRLEVPLAFLAFWAALTFARAAWLGDPLDLALHQLSSGALVVFAFFMISDPMTAPWHPWARLAWLGAVAATGFLLQVNWIVDAGPIFGLVAMAPLVPVLNRLFPAPRASWRPLPSKGETSCAPS